MNIETWTSNKGAEEIHHFVEGDQKTYLFGFNERLLGADLYNEVLQLVATRIKQLEKNNATSLSTDSNSSLRL